MVVMESGACGVVPNGGGAAAAMAPHQQHQQHGQGVVPSSSSSSWYDAAGSAAAAAAAGMPGVAPAADDLADAYFKGQNYFSHMQGAYQGMTNGTCWDFHP